MTRSGDSTQSCRSQTPTVNGGNLTPPTRTQTSELEYSDFGDRYRRPSTPYCSNTPQAFTKNPVICFLEIEKMFRRLWHSPKISPKLGEE